MNATDTPVQPEAPSITNGQEPEPYESPKYFAAIFMTEARPDKPAILRPVKKTRATRAAMEAAVQSGLVQRSTATLKNQAIAVYIVSSAELEKELAPYVKIVR